MGICESGEVQTLQATLAASRVFLQHGKETGRVSTILENLSIIALLMTHPLNRVVNLTIDRNLYT